MNDVVLTIIMSNYNQEKYIEKAIESVLAQKVNFKYQLIITDDCSTKDNSVQLIKKYAEKYPEIIHPLYNNENGGYLVNILRAKEITKTPYFCLLDADDYYTDTNFLQRSFDYLQNHPDYVIYYENVNYLYEDGREEPFINPKELSRTFELKDYFSEDIIIVQTTGQFFRNVIYSKGIPEIVSKSVGTDSERSFEGDYDRFVMHLKYGKAYFNNQICGVYRILSSGIWSRLRALKKELLQLQCWYDYNRYFENEYIDFFVQKMYEQIIKIKQLVNNDIENLKPFNIPQSDISQFINLYDFVVNNKQSLNNSAKFKRKENIIKKCKNKMKKNIIPIQT